MKLIVWILLILCAVIIILYFLIGFLFNPVIGSDASEYSNFVGKTYVVHEGSDLYIMDDLDDHIWAGGRYALLRGEVRFGPKGSLPPGTKIKVIGQRIDPGVEDTFMRYKIYAPCLDKEKIYEYQVSYNDCNSNYKYFSREDCIFLTPYRLVEINESVEDCSVELRSPEEACDEIAEIEYRDICYYTIASYSEEDKEDICDEITNQTIGFELPTNVTIKDLCYLSQIKDKNKTPETCEKIVNISYKDICYTTVSSIQSDPSLCENVITEKSKESCYNRHKVYQKKKA